MRGAGRAERPGGERTRSPAGAQREVRERARRSVCLQGTCREVCVGGGWMRFSARPGSRTASARRRGATRDSRGICADALVRVRSGFASGRSRTSGRVRTHHADGDAFAGISRVPREIPEERTVWCGARGGACEDAKSAEREGERAKSEGASPRPARVSNPGSSLDLRASRSAERRRSWTHCWFAGTASPRSPACARNRSPRADDERGTLCVSRQRRASPPHSRARTRRDATIADHARRSTSRDASRA